MDEHDPWRDVYARAQVLFAQARSGAGADELARLAGRDAAVVVAAVAHACGRRGDRHAGEPDDVVERLRSLLPAFRPQAA
jgi:hypothetical protein